MLLMHLSGRGPSRSFEDFWGRGIWVEWELENGGGLGCWCTRCWCLVPEARQLGEISGHGFVADTESAVWFIGW